MLQTIFRRAFGVSLFLGLISLPWSSVALGSTVVIPPESWTLSASVPYVNGSTKWAYHAENNTGTLPVSVGLSILSFFQPTVNTSGINFTLPGVGYDQGFS